MQSHPCISHMSIGTEINICLCVPNFSCIVLAFSEQYGSPNVFQVFIKILSEVMYSMVSCTCRQDFHLLGSGDLHNGFCGTDTASGHSMS